VKFVLIGDAHLRDTAPSRRVDDFVAAQEYKLKTAFSIGLENEAPIIMTGDVFDSHDAALGTLVKYLPIFQSYPYGVYSPPGNHDLYGASLSTVGRSALGVAVASNAITLLSHDPVMVGDFALFGHSYMHKGKPEPLDGPRNILVTHEMVLMDKLWKEQEDFLFADDYLRKSLGWELIVCGHYHYSFIKERGSRKIINPGALVRIKASKGDMDLKPGVVVYDTETKSAKRISFDVQPSSEVFKPAPKKPKPSEDLIEFAGVLAQQHLSKSTEIPRFDTVLLDVVEKSGCSEDTKKLLLKYSAELEGDSG
jgi:DNA repair exonuclease SbcCD nuclease subunit